MRQSGAPLVDGCSDPHYLSTYLDELLIAEVSKTVVRVFDEEICTINVGRKRHVRRWCWPAPPGHLLADAERVECNDLRRRRHPDPHGFDCRAKGG